MHATKPKQTQNGGERPLAQSVFNGESRLRELEHLAETARKVRDQAAAELTRSGSTHHIARDRIAAAERMLRKTQQEIAELRAQMGPASKPAAAVPTTTPQDFELAVLLGHSKARFNRGDAAQSSLQLQSNASRPAIPAASRASPGAKRTTRTSARNAGGSLGRTLVFYVLIAFGVGIGAIGTYAVVNTGSLAEATRLVREQGQELLTRLRTLMPISAATAQPMAGQPQDGARMHTAAQNTRDMQEAQARAAAEQRLARRLSGTAAHF